MKLMIASDIHGSAYYCQLLMERYATEQPDQLILLGDILYHGPRNALPKDYSPKDVIPMLNAVKNTILCVRGNCDSEVDQMVLGFPIMADYSLVYTDKTRIFVTHGHLYNLDHLPPLQPGEYLLHGHTHVPRWTPFVNHNVYLNPGSVSIPKEDSPHSYMMITDTEMTWKDLDGNTYHALSL